MSSIKQASVSQEQPSALKKAAIRAIGGGASGALAMVAQVGSLMWLRTTMNYQYRHGGGFMPTLKKLYTEGGVVRFYRGLTPALLQGPLSRFGDTAANAGMLELLKDVDLPVAIKTAAASAGAASWRIFLMPIDTLKTTLQVEGAHGMKLLKTKMGAHGPLTLYHGAIGASVATFVGHYPWFATYNVLNLKLPSGEEIGDKLGLSAKLGGFVRSAIMGFSASVVSDTISNSMRVLKTTRQTFHEPISYLGAGKYVIENDGWLGLFGRGLQTRIIANGIQGLVFAVAWKYFQNNLFNQKN